MEYSTVISLVPFALDEQKYGVYPGIFKIPASHGGLPKLLIVGDSIYYQYVGEGRGEYGEIQGKPTRSYIKREVSHKEIARSVVEDFLDGQLARTVGVAEPAIFWVPIKLSLGEVLKDCTKQLEEAKQRQYNWFVDLVKDADDGWEKHRQHKLITDTQRMAAKELGLDRVWLFNIQKGPAFSRCFACKSEIMSDAVVCPVCKAILDAEKYKTVQFAKVG